MPWKPLNPFEPLPPAETPDEMRAAIEQAQRSHPLVRNILAASRVRGLKGEDVYAMLAYHALQNMTTLQQQMLDQLAIAPLPILVPADRGQG